MLEGPASFLRPLGALMLASAFVGCGSSRIVTTTVTQTVAPPPTAQDTKAGPGLLQQPRRKGEIILSGNTAPKSFGPIDFEPGTYTFSFEQYAPEAPDLDFTTQASSITVSLNRKPRMVAPDSQLLVNSTQKQGQNILNASGRYYVDVTSADHSYVLRFTPQP